MHPGKLSGEKASAKQEKAKLNKAAATLDLAARNKASTEKKMAQPKPLTSILCLAVPPEWL